MKKIILPLAAILFSLTACNSYTDERVASIPEGHSSKTELLINSPQKDFLLSIDSISNNLGVRTRKGGMGRVAAASRWILITTADGFGGLAGSGVLSWFTSSAASYAYSKFLDKTLGEQMEANIPDTDSLNYESPDISEFPMLKEIMQDSTFYKQNNDDIAFVFSDDMPQNSEDSIGFVHNKILSKAYQNLSENKSTSLTRASYNDNTFDDIWNTCNNAAKELGYTSIDINSAKKQYDFYCKSIIPLIIKLDSETNKGNDNNTNNILQEISNALNAYNIDGKFITALSQSISKAYSTNISKSNIKEFAEQVNTSLENSSLSEEEKKLAKKFLQTSTSSYVFWSSFLKDKEYNY